MPPSPSVHATAAQVGWDGGRDDAGRDDTGRDAIAPGTEAPMQITAPEAVSAEPVQAMEEAMVRVRQRDIPARNEAKVQPSKTTSPPLVREHAWREEEDVEDELSNVQVIKGPRSAKAASFERVPEEQQACVDEAKDVSNQNNKVDENEHGKAADVKDKTVTQTSVNNSRPFLRQTHRTSMPFEDLSKIDDHPAVENDDKHAHANAETSLVRSDTAVPMVSNHTTDIAAIPDPDVTYLGPSSGFHLEIGPIQAVNTFRRITGAPYLTYVSPRFPAPSHRRAPRRRSRLSGPAASSPCMTRRARGRLGHGRNFFWLQRRHHPYPHTGQADGSGVGSTARRGRAPDGVEGVVPPSSLDRDMDGWPRRPRDNVLRPDSKHPY